MQILERDIEQRVVKEAVKLGLLPPLKMAVMGRRSWPDRLFWLPNGQIIMIEFKRPGCKPTPSQLHMHERLRNQGFKVYVIDSKEQGIQTLRSEVEAALLHAPRS